jgi:hypothetical protein
MSKKEKDKPKEKELLKAKKDFIIKQNEYMRVIRAGESIADIPEVYHANLKTEGVI